MTKKIRVLIVDDSAFSRQAIKKMLEADSDIEIAGIASDGLDAMSKTLKLKPDVITLDFEMPGMDGFSFLRWVMQQNPLPIIMVSSNADRKTVFRALELGAVDFIMKPTKSASVEMLNISQDLLTKIKAVVKLNMNIISRNVTRLERISKKEEESPSRDYSIDLVAIGASTGGPPALQIVLSELPAQFPASIVISQHMPKGFTGSMAERLDRNVGLNVKEADDGDEIERGRVLICPGGYNMKIVRSLRKIAVKLVEPVPEDKYVPSVDLMMMSAAEVYGRRLMGVVLTGMGSDGKDGMISINERGGATLVESEETSVVFGMPAEVIRAGAAQKVAPLYNISKEMIKRVMGDRRRE